MRRLDPKTSVVLVVDVQDKLAAAMPEDRMKDLVRAATVLLEAADLLGARVIATEQYPAGLGRTIAPIGDKLRALRAPVVEKIDFSACDERGFERAWASIGTPRNAIVLGMETHVCVMQTVRELATRGTNVHVIADGVASRRDDHRAIGLELCRAAGATITTMETVVFDWLGRAGTESFKKLSKLIR
ncbi:isochorismatase family protein [Polyangium sp. y55x31]|uniref:isochorismatase family protein n=1 Tax=Polyangium sp. y55x31 TaxID=3042688 RepID=UPI0024828BB5|nr:isochorismatase family protein [Polyangium sp. y55x31]MDI1483844.1 isochorismatase family protein [Polyangium sp. y55x31]